MKLDYDSLPTLMLVAAGLFVMFASPPTVNYDEVESAGKRLGNENNELYGNTYVLGSDESVEIVMDAVAAYYSLDGTTLSVTALYIKLIYINQYLTSNS